MGYHVKKIKKGVYGELSKITEEYEELLDAIDQNAKIMEINELCDLIGAIKGYVEHHHNYSLDDLIKMMSLTEEAFKDGTRN